MRVALRRTVAGDIDTNNSLYQDYRYSDDLTSKRFVRKLNAFFLPQESEITVRDMEPTLKNVCKEQGGPRSLGGDTLDKLEKELGKTMPLDQLDKRRELRDRRLAALAIHRRQEKEEN